MQRVKSIVFNKLDNDTRNYTPPGKLNMELI